MGVYAKNNGQIGSILRLGDVIMTLRCSALAGVAILDSDSEVGGSLGPKLGQLVAIAGGFGVTFARNTLSLSSSGCAQRLGCSSARASAAPAERNRSPVVRVTLLRAAQVTPNLTLLCATGRKRGWGRWRLNPKKCA